MHRIHPVCEETLSPHMGRPVCLVMKDGKHMYGTLGGCRDGKVYLNGCFQGPRLCAVQSKQQLRRVSTKKLASAKKAKSSAYGGYPYGGGYGYGYGAGYDIALIATLFLLPFLFI
ncbi:CubicO group peptidase (beta-lactamase class C family) [Paenibacillus sp. JGP012]|uniref:hypothetical protein n=1 Tax=Paenibacillus TaxID=44249 RepID=UPI001614101A|nr:MULTISPECIES: hypothetical protein [Paenibacillus]MBB6024767.1 CubicO group peptidase (beta-lactamase class C family) [Paenibacillus sp. JGP012]MBU5356510.1 hypothetical protein [Paenibacillus barcinonensis]MDM5280348.1 hypothetical protein [Paenibacillus silvae]